MNYYKTKRKYFTTRLSTRVRAGVARLDAHVASWREKIALDYLDMGSSDHSILKQVFPGSTIAHALASLGLIHPSDGYAYGFDIAKNFEYAGASVQVEEWAKLTRAWKRELVIWLLKEKQMTKGQQVEITARYLQGEKATIVANPENGEWFNHHGFVWVKFDNEGAELPEQDPATLSQQWVKIDELRTIS